MKWEGLRLTLMIVAIIALLVSCVIKPPPPTPVRTVTPLQFISPLNEEDAVISPISSHGKNNGRSLTAMEAFPLAQSHARSWNPEAVFIGILPSRSMQQNLGLPPGELGWFFQFQSPDTGDELFVQIIDNELYGSTVAHPITGELPFTFQTIDMGQIAWDSSDVLNFYLRSEEGKKYTQKYDDAEWDFRLVYLSTYGNPVWSLFDIKRSHTSLLNIDAITGQLTNDPFP